MAKEYPKSSVYDKPIRLAILIPMSWDYVYKDWFIGYVNMKMLPPPHETYLLLNNDQPLDHNRNALVKMAIEWGATHLMWLDGDIILPEDGLLKLISHDLPIVGALCYHRVAPYRPVLFAENPRSKHIHWYMENYPNGLVDVHRTGTGALLVKREVMDRLEYPWFRFRDDPLNPGRMLGEDLYFCEKAHAAGYKIFVDCSIKAKHLRVDGVSEKHWLSAKPQVGSPSKIEIPTDTPRKEVSLGRGDEIASKGSCERNKKKRRSNRNHD